MTNGSPSELNVELIKGGQSLATTVDLGVATEHGFAKKGRGQKEYNVSREGRANWIDEWGPCHPKA